MVKTFAFSFYKGREQVKETDEWDIATYTIFGKGSNMIDFKLNTQKELADFRTILDRVYNSGVQDAKEEIRVSLGIKD